MLFWWFRQGGHLSSATSRLRSEKLQFHQYRESHMVLLLDADFPDDLPVRDPQMSEDRVVKAK